MMFYAVVVAGLTIIYGLALASFAWQDLLLGCLLSVALVGVYRSAVMPKSTPEWGYVLHIIVFLPKFLAMMVVDIVKGTWQVAMFVVGFRKLENPGIIRIPIGNHTPAGVGIVGLVVTISPGSFLVDVDWDERMMLVHYIDTSEPDRLREDVEKYYRLWEYGTHIPPDLQQREAP